MREGITAHGLLLALVLGCSVGFTNNASVEVIGSLSVEEKTQLAKEIVDEVWSAGLRSSVLERFPSVSESDLSQFSVHHRVMTFDSLTDDSGPHTTVWVQCSLRHAGSMPKAEEIVDYCLERVSEAMRARGLGPPAV